MSTPTHPPVARYRGVMAEIQQLLDDNDGHLLSTHLYAGIDAPKWQVNNCIGYLGCVKIAGAAHFSPTTVWDPAKLPADLVPAEDKWLRSMYDTVGADSLPTDELLRVGRQSGFSKAQLDRAMTRLGCTPRRVGAKWHRWAPGKAPAPADVDAQLSADDAAAQLGASVGVMVGVTSDEDAMLARYPGWVRVILLEIENTPGDLRTDASVRADFAAGWQGEDAQVISRLLAAIVAKGWIGEPRDRTLLDNVVEPFSTLTDDGRVELQRLEAMAPR